MYLRWPESFRTQFAVMMITTPTREEAERIGRRILRKKLAACVSILPVSSHYWWKRKIEDAEETLMLVKTTFDLVERIVRVVQIHHSYEVPEVIALPIIEGNRQYLQWIDDSVRPSRKKSG